MALLLAACAGAPPPDTLTTNSISPRRMAAYENEPIPKGIAGDDWAAARIALSEALRADYRTSPSVPWDNYANATQGTVTPLGPTPNLQGTCRAFLMSFVNTSKGGASEEWVQGEACRTAKGWWKVDQARMLERS